MQFIYAKTKNTNAGNPRRVYAIYDDNGTPKASWPEGYAGINACPKELRDHFKKAPALEVSVLQYARLMELPHPIEAYES